MSRICAVVTAITLASMVSGTAFADETSFRTKQAGQFEVRARVLTVLTQAGQNINNNVNLSEKTRVTNDVEPELDLSYFITDNIAVEAIAGWTSNRVKMVGSVGHDISSVRVLPPTVTAQYHFLTQNRISPYLGAGFNYSFIFAEHNDIGNSVHFTNAYGPAIQAGIDIALVGGLSLNLDVKKIYWISGTKVNADLGNLAPGATASTKANLNPLLVGIGIGYRF